MPRDLQYLLDYQELRDIVSRAAMALDSRRFDDWLDLCTDDVVLIVPFDPENPIVCTGKDAFRDQLGILHQFVATTHFTGAMVADIDGDTALTQTYCLAHHLKETPTGRANFRQSVLYKDHFRRINGAWRMIKRDMVINWSEVCPSPDLDMGFFE